MCEKERGGGGGGERERDRFGPWPNFPTGPR